MPIASLCLLAFERPEFLDRTLRSLVERTTGQYELIVHNDGSLNPLVNRVIDDYKSHISFIVENCGENMGVGASMRRCARMASGEYIFKVDTDLEFMPNWLEQSVNILENNQDVCAVGQFDYRNYDPGDERFNKIEGREDCWIVDDFVNSVYGFRKFSFLAYGHDMGDDGWQQYLKEKTNQKLAITKLDVVHNYGFGLQHSVYMDADGNPRKVSLSPKINNYDQP